MISLRKGSPPGNARPSHRPSRPPLDTIPPSPPGKIGRMREKLAAYAVVDKRPKIVFGNVLRNIIGMSQIHLCGADMIVLRTQMSLYILSNQPPEELYELAGGLGSVDLKWGLRLMAPGGGLMYLSRITQEELRQIMNVTTIERMSAKRLSIPPPESSVLSIDELRLKLAKCTVASSPDQGFDPAEFAASLESISVSKDFKGMQYYHLTIKGDEEGYRMYVNPEGISSSEAITLTYNKDVCVLVKEIV